MIPFTRSCSSTFYKYRQATLSYNNPCFVEIIQIDKNEDKYPNPLSANPTKWSNTIKKKAKAGNFIKKRFWHRCFLSSCFWRVTVTVTSQTR